MAARNITDARFASPAEAAKGFEARPSASVSPSVHQDYKYHSEKHMVAALGSKRVRKITIRDVDQFLKSKSNGGHAVARSSTSTGSFAGRSTSQWTGM